VLTQTVFKHSLPSCPTDSMPFRTGCYSGSSSSGIVVSLMMIMIITAVIIFKIMFVTEVIIMILGDCQNFVIFSSFEVFTWRKLCCCKFLVFVC